MSDLSRIRRIIEGALGEGSPGITAETRMQDVPEWDSVAQVKIVLAVEAEYGIQVDPDQISTLDSVKAYLDLVAGSKR